MTADGCSGGTRDAEPGQRPTGTECSHAECERGDQHASRLRQIGHHAWGQGCIADSVLARSPGRCGRHGPSWASWSGASDKFGATMRPMWAEELAGLRAGGPGGDNNACMCASARVYHLRLEACTATSPWLVEIPELTGNNPDCAVLGFGLCGLGPGD